MTDYLQAISLHLFHERNEGMALELKTSSWSGGREGTQGERFQGKFREL